jgi:HEAT repeat protein
MRFLLYPCLFFAVINSGCGRGSTAAKLSAPIVVGKNSPEETEAHGSPDHHVQDMLATLRDHRAERRPEVLHEINAGGIPSERIAPAVLEIAQDPKDPLQREAIATLGYLPEAQESVDALLILAHDDDPLTRRGALQALGKRGAGSAKVQVTIRKSLRDQDANVRLAALAALGSGDLPELLAALHHPEARFRLTAVETLWALGPAAQQERAALARVAREDAAMLVRRTAQAALREMDAQ